MYKKAIEVLNIFHQNGYLAYIVGGYPRDYLLGINSLLYFMYDKESNMKTKHIIILLLIKIPPLRKRGDLV
mgnify:CR=1 FL=1